MLSRSPFSVRRYTVPVPAEQPYILRCAVPPGCGDSSPPPTPEHGNRLSAFSDSPNAIHAYRLEGMNLPVIRAYSPIRREALLALIVPLDVGVRVGADVNVGIGEGV